MALFPAAQKFSPQKLEELHSLLQPSTEKETVSFSWLREGLPRGAIVEISGTGKTEFVARFLSEHPETRVAWVEDNFSVFPFALLQRQVRLEQILFVEVGASVSEKCQAPDLDWSLFQILKAQIFGVVVLQTDRLDLRTARRLQLFAERSNATLFWLTDQPQPLWPVSLQLQVQREADASVSARIVRQKY